MLPYKGTPHLSAVHARAHAGWPHHHVLSGTTLLWLCSTLSHIVEGQSQGKKKDVG